MAAPHVDSFLATNFRAFKHLEIPNLHQVNLIVGKNSVGKSCLLEALHVYARDGAWDVVTEILTARGEMQQLRPSSVATSAATELATTLESLSYLFYGRIALSEDSPEISLGPLSKRGDQTFLRVKWLPTRTTIEQLPPDSSADRPIDVVDNEPYFQWGNKNDKSKHSSVLLVHPRLWLRGEVIRNVGCTYVSSNSLSQEQMETYWDAISLTDYESEALSSLQVVAEGVTGLSLIASRRGTRTPIVRLEGTRKPVPLKSLGDGMTRMLGLSLAAVNARNGMLLIDEVENGLHYSVQANMWRVLFHLAHELNVQVFASSHSWDCVQAFQQVASERTDVEGGLIRLDRKDEQVIPTTFDEEELEIVTREQIEVR